MPIKLYALMLPCLLISVLCDAQDSLAVRNKLSDSVAEHFYVLKSNPDVRVGRYTAILRRKKLLCVGNYNNGRKAGTWQFFDVAGRLNEKYNYDKGMFTYEAPLYANADLQYMFDDSIKHGDKLTRPLKIGGIYMGYVPYLNIFRLPFSTLDIDTYYFGAAVELLISPLGRLAGYRVRLVSDFYQYDRTFTMDTSLFSEEDKTFTPATFNSQPVMCRIFIKCFVTTDGTLDFY